MFVCFLLDILNLKDGESSPLSRVSDYSELFRNNE